MVLEGETRERAAAQAGMDRQTLELWPKLGDGGLRKAAYRGG
jgi:hypothetical protein